jgi:predicted metalloprotease
MKRELPAPMSKNDLFADREALVRGGMDYVIAHEFSHLFQHVRSQAGDPVPTNQAAFELQADCIAGLWLGYQPSAMLHGGTPVIRGALATAMVFGNSVGDFPAVGVQEQIDATGHSTGVKRMSCVQSGIGSGRIQKFGNASTAFQSHAKDILLWAADGAQHYLTPFPGGSQNK